MQGKKFDLGKSRMSLLPLVALREVGNVLTYGEQKYQANNWLGGMAWSRVQDALLRHLERFQMGEDKDPESGLLHTAQIACNALFLLTFQLLGLGEDDRWKCTRPDYQPSDLISTIDKPFTELDPDNK